MEHADESLPEVLAEWSIRPVAISLIQDHGNVHWRVETAATPLILRRYRPETPVEEIDYEFTVLRHLAGRGWPVASPIEGLRWYGGMAYALFPLLAGAPRPSSPDHRRALGRLLARLHLDLADTAALGQKPGWWKLIDEDITGNARRWRSGAVSAVPQADPDLAGALTAHIDPVAERLAGSGIEHTPTFVIHSDLIPQNVLYDEHDRLTGLLDLDMAHLDRRAVDVASGRRSHNDEFVGGYTDITRLSDGELGVLDDLYRARVLSWGLAVLEGRVDADINHELRQCVRWLDQTRRFIPV